MQLHVSLAGRAHSTYITNLADCAVRLPTTMIAGRCLNLAVCRVYLLLSKVPTKEGSSRTLTRALPPRPSANQARVKLQYSAGALPPRTELVEFDKPVLVCVQHCHRGIDVSITHTQCFVLGV
jgi:hypothetical protein